MTRLYSTQAAADIIGSSYRVVDYWARDGVVVPLIAGVGSGTKRRYAAAQLPVLRVARVLARIGAADTVRHGAPTVPWLRRALAPIQNGVPADGFLVIGESATSVVASLDEVVVDGATVIVSFAQIHDDLAVAVSSSPNLHTVCATGGGETGPARPLAVEHTGSSLLGLAGSRPSSDDPTYPSPTSGVGEDGGVLDPFRGTAPGCTPEPADNCAL